MNSRHKQRALPDREPRPTRHGRGGAPGSDVPEYQHGLGGRAADVLNPEIRGRTELRTGLGHAADTVAEAAALADFNGLAATKANEVLLSLCGSTAWAKTMGAHRPYKSVRSLMKAAEGAWWGLGESDWREAFAAHPQIGEQKKAVTATVQSATWSTGEQSGVTNATVDVGERLASLNARYLEVHGFIYIVCASGKSAGQLLSLLESRIDNPTSVELDRAAREQMQITRLRLEKWLKSAMNKGA